MARPTVRIQPPQAGDEDWLASMIAPLLDDDADELARAFAVGPVTVGPGLDAAEARELVEVLRGFGAEADLVEPPVPSIATPSINPTQPFDGARLRELLDAQPPVKRSDTTGSMGLFAQTRSAGPIPPPLQPSDSLPPMRISRQATDEPAPANRGAPPLMTGNAVLPLAPPPTPDDPPPARLSPTPIIDSKPPKRTGAPILPQRSVGPAPPAGAPPHHVNGAEAPAKLPPQLAGRDAAREAPRKEVPPWFPQMSIHPGGEEEVTREGRSWLWIVLIMLVAGAAAWWLRGGG